MFHRFIFLGVAIAFGMSLHAQELTDKQRNLAGRYAQLEQVLLRLAETSATANPRRATLLNQALHESRDKLLVQRFDTLVNALERRQLTDAISGQTEIEEDLLALLRLLESENRHERRDSEKEQIQEFLKDIEEILHSERTLRNQTRQQETQNLPMLEGTQREIRMRTQALQDRMAEHESPSQQALQRAIERMRQVEQQLLQAERGGAIEEQEEAIAELQRLREELERILRQLREEELKQTLEKLEERFRRMLRQEQTIRSQTERLINELERESSTDQRQFTIRADRLGIDQQSVIDDAEAVLVILREDGTAQAMVESLLQARFDMVEVKNRLERTALDTVTLHVIDTIIDALQEMLDAVQAAIEEARQRQENTGNQQPGDTTTEEPLIQLLAELRMIRSMQRRVNERTIRYDNEIKQLLEKPDADLSHLRLAVEELARQQNRISRILHELRIGRTE